METLSIYIHFPFCLSKCIYCDFNSAPLSHLTNNISAELSKKDEEIVNDYVQCLCREIEIKSDKKTRSDITVDSIYFGGGTPSLMSLSNIEKIMNKISSLWNCSSDCEITIECNPATLSRDKLVSLKSSGINRLSVGCQSFNDRELNFLGRIHNTEDNSRIINYAQEAGFDNISIDIIFAVPGSTLESWEDTLFKTTSLPVRHISCYGLTIEEGTPLFKIMEKDETTPLDDEIQREMYLKAVNVIKSSGFNHYEISNFAKDNSLCRHNLNYWNGGNYIGIGLSAHSCKVVKNNTGQYESIKRIWNTEDLNDYFTLIKSGQIPSGGEEYLTGKKLFSEAVMLGLRKIKGISLPEFKRRYNTDITLHWKEELNLLGEAGLIYFNNETMHLTEEGLLLSNEVFRTFF